jgi:hypothetical protein
MDTVSLNSGQAIRIYDYSPHPRTLLVRLSAPIAEFSSATWFPIMHIRRGWLHGSHAVVTVRPPAGDRPSRARDLTGLIAGIGAAIEPLHGTPPDSDTYLAQAEALGRWENVPGPYLPVQPQGHIDVSPEVPPAGWPDGLVLARDLMLARLMNPILSGAAHANEIAPYALRVLSIVAATHPAGIEIGTLPYRSHSEAALTWRAGATTLRSAFDGRFGNDSALFHAALTDPIGSAPAGEVESLRLWQDAAQHCWGVGTGLALSGAIDRGALNAAGRLIDSPDVVRGAETSAFHEQMNSDGFSALLPYWHLAHRLVVNVIYQSLACLGLSAVSRYYLCYGLAEATDHLLGSTWSQRLTGYARDREAALA